MDLLARLTESESLYSTLDWLDCTRAHTGLIVEQNEGEIEDHEMAQKEITERQIRDNNREEMKRKIVQRTR